MHIKGLVKSEGFIYINQTVAGNEHILYQYCMLYADNVALAEAYMHNTVYDCFLSSPVNNAMVLLAKLVFQLRVHTECTYSELRFACQ